MCRGGIGLKSPLTAPRGPSRVAAASFGAAPCEEFLTPRLASVGRRSAAGAIGPPCRTRFEPCPRPPHWSGSVTIARLFLHLLIWLHSPATPWTRRKGVRKSIAASRRHEAARGLCGLAVETAQHRLHPDEATSRQVGSSRLGPCGPRPLLCIPAVKDWRRIRLWIVRLMGY